MEGVTQEYKWREILDARIELERQEERANGKKDVGYKTEKKQIQKKISICSSCQRKKNMFITCFSFCLYFQRMALFSFGD